VLKAGVIKKLPILDANYNIFSMWMRKYG